MAYAVSTADIEARWRPLSAAEAPVAQQLLADAAVKLDAARPALAAAVAVGVVAAELVKIVLVDMVKAVLRNPDALAGTQLGADGSIGVTYATGTAAALAGRLSVLDADLGSIDAALASGGGTVSGAFTVPVFARPFASRPFRY